MDRRDFDFCVKDYPLNSVKRACYIVREYIRNKESGAVSKEEYDKALRILLAYSYTTSDEKTTVETWSCDSDCSKNTGFGFCDGEFQLEPKKPRCKHFSDSWNI